MYINDKSLTPEKILEQESRYGSMTFNRCGQSGIQLPAISLGLWHNFGQFDDFQNARDIVLKAFDLGIVHIDLANNYGPPYGTAEETFGKILQGNLGSYRNELFISTKAGYDMWPGPYGNLGSRKYLMSSLDDSLKRMGLDYVDLFYHHRPDANTPLEETMTALADIVKQGKALYVGLSNYQLPELKEATQILKELKVPCLINQVKYSILNRSVTEETLSYMESVGMGCIAFSPLAQGMLTNKYLGGIPKDSRAAKSMTYLEANQVENAIPGIRKLNEIAQNRGQELAHMALAWVLHQTSMTSVLIGASSTNQLVDNLKCMDQLTFSAEELKAIEDAIA